MNKVTVIVLVVLAVILGAWVARSQGWLDGSAMKNADMLNSGSTVPIVTESGVEYFAGAQGYYARPEAQGEYPGVVMIHENRGLRPEIRQTADDLARQGYQVLAVDLFQGKVAEDQTGARALTGAFDQQAGIENMQAAAAFLRERGADRIASLGWCFGGKQSLELAMSGERLDATVVYYGGGMATTTDRLAAITWPVLGIFGDQDQVLPVETVRQFEASLNELDIQNEVYIYPGVGHAFANPSGDNYAPEATQDAWAKTLAFLERNLKN